MAAPRSSARMVAVAILAWLSVPQAAAQTAADLCSRATTTATVAPVTAETFSYGGTDRHYCTCMSSLIGAGTQHPLVIALHGGDGNASQMMEDARRIIEHAEAMGWIAVFPNGLPRGSCGGASLCLDNNWAASDNVFFIAEPISRLKAGGQVQDDRVRDGRDRVDRVRNSALLAQGALDPKLPVAGGLDATGRESHASFRTKVDYWRLVTCTEAATPQGVDVVALAGAPADVAAARYSDAGLSVVEVLDPNLAHAWPGWDIMAVMVELFERS